MRHKISNLQLRLALLLSLATVRTAVAQPGIAYLYHTSLEAMIARSPSVFRGTITDFTRTVIIPRNGYMTNVEHLPEKDVTYLTRMTGGVVKYTIRVNLDEVIKSPGRKNIKSRLPSTATFVLQTSDYDKEIEQWTAQHTSFLCFADLMETNLLAASPTPASWEAIRHVPASWNAIRLGEPAPAERSYNGMIIKPPVYLMDNTETSNAQEILAHARSFAKQHPAATNTFQFGFLTIPVTPALEKTGHQLAAKGNPDGVRALRYFKSAQNIKLLKPLLNNPGYQDNYIVNLPWYGKRVYETRLATYEVLSEWKVNVSRPITEEALPWHYDPAAREKTEIGIPTKLWTERTTNTLQTAIHYDGIEITNIMTGSNMVVGATFQWFVYPEGSPRPVNPTRLDHQYQVNGGSSEYFVQPHDGLPAPGKKYMIELAYTAFETDLPPFSDPEECNTWHPELWRPQDGKNYHILLQRHFVQMSD